jgi:hypothetical protein
LGCRIAALAQGRTREENDITGRSISSIRISTERRDVRVNGQKDEDTKLKNAVKMNGVKNWLAIAALIPRRKKIQCRRRWQSQLQEKERTAAKRNPHEKESVMRNSFTRLSTCSPLDVDADDDVNDDDDDGDGTDGCVCLCACLCCCCCNSDKMAR